MHPCLAGGRDPRGRAWVVSHLCPGGEREGHGEGMQPPQMKALRRDEEPLGHLEEKGSSVLLLQGLFQLLHIALQFQILIPGIFHLLLAQETLLILSYPLLPLPRGPMNISAPDHC